MRSLADTIISMPSVASSISTGYSNSNRRARPKSSKVIKSVSAAATRMRILRKRVRPSETKPPLNTLAVPLPAKTAAAASTRTPSASHETVRPAASALEVKTPIINSAMAPIARISSGRTT